MTLTFNSFSVCRTLAVAIVGVFGLCISTASNADESGISFWLPGSFGSFAAVPGAPGFSMAATYYHTDVRSGSNVATAVTLPRNTLSINIDASIKAKADIAILSPTYTFATPVFGGQLAFTLFGVFGRAQTEIDANITGALGPIGFGASRSISDSLTGLGDLLPQLALRWNDGAHNFMIYGRGGIPVGDYEAGRIANVGKGHGAADGGFGYTYLNPATGYEFSAVTGLTYNLKNNDTDYQNGVNLHIDLAAAKYVTKQMFVGAVGYYYDQLTGDSGSGTKLGDYRSRVAAIGPQLGFTFPVGEMSGFLNLKGYWEFAAQNRSEGWNTWVVFSVSPAAKPAGPR